MSILLDSFEENVDDIDKEDNSLIDIIPNVFKRKYLPPEETLEQIHESNYETLMLNRTQEATARRGY